MSQPARARPGDKKVTCPVRGCSTVHLRTYLMCRRHWRGLPKDLRDAVWGAFRRHGVLSEEYQDARADAINFYDEEARPA